MIEWIDAKDEEPVHLNYTFLMIVKGDYEFGMIISDKLHIWKNEKWEELHGFTLDLWAKLNRPERN